MSLESEVIRILNRFFTSSKKISAMENATALDGTELVEIVQDGVNVKTTTQDIADLGGGGGGGSVDWGDVGGVLSNQTDLQAALDLKQTAAQVASAIAAVVDSSPATLDTLNELAAALGDDPNFAATTATAIGLRLLKSGDTMSGNLALGGNKVTGSAAASANGELVRYEQITGLASVVNSAGALTDGGTIDLTATKHTLATSSATRTFTISYTGDDITMEVTLSNTAATYTFPAAALCVSEGVASGNNTLALAGVSGDKYIITVKKIGSAYYVVSKNFGQ